MTSSDSLKSHKDTFVSALAEFRKVSNDLSDAAIGLVGAIDKAGLFSDDDKHEITRFTNAFSGNSKPPKQEASADSPESSPVEETKGKKQKKKRETDPNQPKRPLPLVLEYLNAEKKRIREQRVADQEPALEMSELNTLARQAWDEVPQVEKDQLIANHDQRIAKYQAELSAYKAKKEAQGDAKEPASELASEPASEPSSSLNEDESKKRKKDKDSSPEKKDKKRKKKKESKESKE